MSPWSDGRRIVYVQSGYLCVLDAATGTSRKVPVRIPSDDWRLQDRWINPSEYLHFVDVAVPAGARLPPEVGPGGLAWPPRQATARESRVARCATPPGERLR